MKSHLRLVPPNTENVTVANPDATRKPNKSYRTREYLTEAEVMRLVDAVKGNRNTHRDACMIMVAFRHGLRAAELVDLKWSQIDFRTAVLHVTRVKKGSPASHQISGDELRMLRKLQKDAPASPFVFVSERSTPFTTAGFQRLVERAGEAAGFEFPVHPHMLRHACGYELANRGKDTRTIQGYLGHRNIQHTVKYTELAPDRFKDIWKR
jgi:integrase